MASPATSCAPGMSRQWLLVPETRETTGGKVSSPPPGAGTPVLVADRVARPLLDGSAVDRAAPGIHTQLGAAVLVVEDVVVPPGDRFPLLDGAAVSGFLDDRRALGSRPVDR